MRFLFKINWKTCLKLGITFFAVFICITYWQDAIKYLELVLAAASPLIIGGVIAYIVNILMAFYERRFFPHAKKGFWLKVKRPLCILSAFITLVAIISLIVVLVAPQAASCVMVVVNIMPDAMKSFVKWLDGFYIIPKNVIDALSGIDWKSLATKFIDVFTSGFGNVVDFVTRTVTTVFSGIFTAILSIIFSVYLLSSKDKLLSQVKTVSESFLPKKIFNKIFYVFAMLNNCFRKFIIGQCTEAVILGVLCTIGMMILRLPYAEMIGALIALTAIIPIIGAFLGAAVGAFMILTVDPVKALVFIIFILLLQQLEGNLIYPRVVGTSIGLPSLWVLASVTIGAGVFGFTGVLVSVPIAATIYHLVRNHIISKKIKAEIKLEKQAEETQAPENGEEKVSE